MGFWTVLIDRFHYYDSCLKRRTVDSCGNSTCLKTPQSAFLEEAEAVPAESNGPQRKTNPRICRSLYQLRGLKDRKSTRLNSSHVAISYAVFCLKKKTAK